MVKKLMLLIVMLIIAISAGQAYADTASYADAGHHWADDAIMKWTGYGVIRGMPDGKFHPDDYVTRGQVAVILDNLMKYQTKYDNVFKDIGQAYYSDAMLKTFKAGIILGYNGELRPNDNVTREEAAVIIARAFGIEESSTDLNYMDASSVSDWAKGYVSALTEAGYLKGYNGYYYPGNKTTRAELITMMNNIVAAIYSIPGTYSGDIQGTVVVASDDVILEKMNIHGSLVIAEGVGAGECEIRDTTIDGSVIVRGGGSHSVKITGSSNVKKVVVNNKDNEVRIYTDKGVVVQQLSANERVILDGDFPNVEVVGENAQIQVNGTVGTMNVESSAEIRTTTDGKVGTLNVSDAGTLSLKGNFEAVSIDSKGTDINLESGTDIRNITTGANSEDVSVNVPEGAHVANVVAEGTGTVIQGEGEVEYVEAKTADVTVTTGNTTVSSAEGTTVTPPTGGTTVVTPGGGNSNGTYVPKVAYSVSITPQQTTLQNFSGNYLQMYAYVKGTSTVSQNVIWSTSDQFTATINATGKLVPHRAGTVTVYAHSADSPTIFGYADITIEDPDAAWDGTIAASYERGSGLADDPYIIRTAAQLALLYDQVTMKQFDTRGIYYKLVSDIDLGSHPWTPVGGTGTKTAFRGVFDGGGFKIRNLRIVLSKIVYGEIDMGDHYENGYTNSFEPALEVGLFGKLDGAVVKNLGIENGIVSGTAYVGAVAGYSLGSTISNCYAKVNVTAEGYYDEPYNNQTPVPAGALVGRLSYSTLVNSYSIDSSVEKSISSNLKFSYIGGLVGLNDSGGQIENCYVSTYITSYGDYTGAITGQNKGTILNSYWNRDMKYGDELKSTGLNYDSILKIKLGAETNAVSYTADSMKARTFVDLLNSHNNGQIKWAMAESNFPGFETSYLRFELNGGALVTGTIDDIDAFVVGSTVTLPDVNLTKAGYYFAGWWFMSNNTYYEKLHDNQPTSWYGTAYAKWIPASNPQAWNGSVSNGYAGGSGTEADPYLIETPGQLAYMVNNAYAEYYKLMKDIDLGGIDLGDGTWTGPEWKPISGPEGIDIFAGTFDGNSHVIKNIYIDESSKNDLGLFGVNGGVIMNLGIEKGYIRGAFNAGGIAGNNDIAITINGAQAGRIENCYTDVDVYGSYSGGLAGYNRIQYTPASTPAVVSNSYSFGKAYGRQYAHGDIGRNDGSITNIYWNSSANLSGLGAGMAAEDFAGADFLAALNNGSGSNSAWERTDGINGGNPTFVRYDVTFSAGENATPVEAQTNLVKGDKVTAPEEPEKDGYFFVDWYSDSNLTEPWDFDNGLVDGDMTLYAKWLVLRTVTFDAQSGSSADPVSVPDSYTYTLPASSRTGYTFDGWYTEANGAGTKYTDETSITSDMTLYANWTRNNYTVTFDSQGGSGVDPVEVLYDNEFGTLPGEPDYTGYDFMGWFTGQSGTGTKLTAVTHITGNVTYYADWDTSLDDVSFDSDGGTAVTPAIISVEYGAAVGSLPSEPARDGYQFDGWYTGSNGTGTVFTAETAVTSDMVVYAKWILCHTVRFFEFNDSVAMPVADPASVSTEYAGLEKTVTDGDTMTMPAAQITREGYGMDGWYTLSDAAVTGQFEYDAKTTDVTSITTDLNLYAKWEKLIKVTFMKNSSVPDEVYAIAYVPVGEYTVELPSETPYKSGNYFSEWNTAADGTGSEFTSSTEVTGDTVVYAKYWPNGVWNGKAAAEFAGGSGTSEDPYQISTGMELAYLAQQVNNGNSYGGTYFILTGDLNMGGDLGLNFTPIGMKTKNGSDTISHDFNGSFNGNDHTIGNLKIYEDRSEAVGLFGVNGGAIANLTVAGSYTLVWSGGTGTYPSLGGIAGVNNNYIENCHSQVALSVYENITARVGGIAGDSSGIITGSSNSGTVTGNKFVGGIVGDSWEGGIANSWNTGWVISNGVLGGESYVGGIAGRWASHYHLVPTAPQYNSGTLLVNCYNTGKVEGSVSSNQYGKMHIGGIVGYWMDSESWTSTEYVIETTIISNTYNAGVLTAPGFIQYSLGGIVGTAVNADGYALPMLADSFWSDAVTSGVGSGSFTDSGSAASGNLNSDAAANTLNLNKDTYASTRPGGARNLWIRDAGENGGYPYLDLTRTSP